MHTGDVCGYAEDELSFSHRRLPKSEEQPYWLTSWPQRSFYCTGVNWFWTNMH